MLCTFPVLFSPKKGVFPSVSCASISAAKKRENASDESTKGECSRTRSTQKSINRAACLLLYSLVLLSERSSRSPGMVPNLTSFPCLVLGAFQMNTLHSAHLSPCSARMDRLKYEQTACQLFSRIA